MTKYGYLDKQDRAERAMGLGFSEDDETPSGRRVSLVDDRTLWDPHRLPENEYQALMEADFMEEPELDQATAEAMWEAMCDKLHTAGLTDDELLVVDCVVFGGMSLATTGQYLARERGVNKAVSKQQIQRIRDKAFDKLRKVFQEETE